MSNHIRRNYLPETETEAYVWLTNLAQQLPGVVANALGITSTQTNALQKATQLLTDVFRWQKNAKALSEERTGNKDEALWNPLGHTVYIRPNTTATGPDTLTQSECGALPLAVTLCDEILLNKTGRLDAALRELLRLSPLPKKTPPATAGEKPAYTAHIEKNQLTVHITKGGYEYFIIKTDHGTGQFNAGATVLHSPWRDPAPLPVGEPQLWRVQVIGYTKGATVGIPGDIIDIAAKAYQAEHSEGAN
jgi:hypothetical protein